VLTVGIACDALDSIGADRGVDTLEVAVAAYMTVQGQILGVNTPEAPVLVRTLRTCSMTRLAASSNTEGGHIWSVHGLFTWWLLEWYDIKGVGSIYLHAPLMVRPVVADGQWMGLATGGYTTADRASWCGAL